MTKRNCIAELPSSSNRVRFKVSDLIVSQSILTLSLARRLASSLLVEVFYVFKGED